MIISYQNKRFCFTEFDNDGNEYSNIWSIPNFYNDFPFLPRLDMNEINSISFEDERPLYLISYRESLNRPALKINDPNEDQFFKAIAENKEIIRTKAYESLTSGNQEEPARDIIKEFDELKSEFLKIKADIDNLIAYRLME